MGKTTITRQHVFNGAGMRSKQYSQHPAVCRIWINYHCIHKYSRNKKLTTKTRKTGAVHYINSKIHENVVHITSVQD